MRLSTILAGTMLLAAAQAASADTTAVFALEAPTGRSAAWGDTISLVVTSTHNVRMPACAFRLVAEGDAALALMQRAVASPLRYLGANAAAPLDGSLPRPLAGGAALAEVFINLDTAVPSGNSQDGLAAGADVTLVTYTFVATRAGTLTLRLEEPRAAETQSTPDGKMFDSATMSASGGAITLTIAGGPDLDGDGHVDLRDFAQLQRCFGQQPEGACASADLDLDGDVDAVDFSQWKPCLLGPSATWACAPESGGQP